MKKISTLLLGTLFFVSFQSFSQGITFLPSFGVQSTSTTITGNSPFLRSGKQHETTPQLSIRAFNNQRSGFFVGFSTINSGLYIKSQDENPYEFGNWALTSRLEAGYQWTSKPIYLKNSSMEKKRNDFFLQFQPMLGFGYNLAPNSNYGGMTSSGHYQMDYSRYVNGNVSLLMGGNIFLGRKNKPFLFISVMKNTNFSGVTQTAVLTTQNRNTTYTQYISTKGSGTSWSIGVPIRIGVKNKK